MIAALPYAEHKGYRADIDGLRAVAVLSVIAYHFGLTLIPGGFTGVDIFFVISGYLITGIILEEIRTGKFSIIRFYERRARRILPALSVVVVAVFLASYFLAMPSQMVRIGREIASTSLFVSNFYYFLTVDYFSDGVDRMPLVHTWSLAIEEQFYLFLPLLLFWLRKRSRIACFLVFSVGVSMLANLIMIRNYPAFTFYMIVTRWWELGIGSLLAFYKPEVGPRGREILGFGGVALIGSGLLAIDESTPFPGLHALLPTLGCAALIVAGSGGVSSISRLLSARPAVAIGLISYSAYLWHWPIKVLAPLAFENAAAPAGILAMTAATFALAWTTWRYVEQPFRGQEAFLTSRGVFVSAAAALSLILIAGSVGHFSRGMPWRFPPIVASFDAGNRDVNPDTARCNQKTAADVMAQELCIYGPAGSPRKILLVGDSHANALAPLFKKEAAEKGVAVIVATRNGCFPVSAADVAVSDECRLFSKALAEGPLTDPSLTDVVLAVRWSVHLSGTKNTNDSIREFRVDPQNAKRLTELAAGIATDGRRVWIVVSPPETGMKTPDFLARKAIGGDKETDVVLRLEPFHAVQREIMQTVSKGAGGAGVHVLDLAAPLCSDSGDCKLAVDGRSLYFDDDHLSTFGVMYLAPLFAPIFATGAAAR